MQEALGYRIAISGESDAFSDGEFHAEMARILRKLADDIERGKMNESLRLFDVSGNVVGECLADF